MTVYDPRQVAFLLGLSPTGSFTTDDDQVWLWRAGLIGEHSDGPVAHGACRTCADYDDGRPWMASFPDIWAIGSFLSQHQHDQSPSPTRGVHTLTSLRHIVDLLFELAALSRQGSQTHQDTP